MSVFLARFDHLVVDWDLNLSLAVYMAGSPYTSAELNLISSTFDTLVTNLRSFLTVSICTDVWCDRLDSVLSVCRHHISDLLRSISLAHRRLAAFFHYFIPFLLLPTLYALTHITAHYKLPNIFCHFTFSFRDAHC